MALFSKPMIELMKLSDGRTAKEVEADFKWFMGNNGTAHDLSTGKLVAVPVGLGVTPTDVLIQCAIYRSALSMFCTCLSDSEAEDRYWQAKRWLPRMRASASDSGVTTTTPLVRLIDPSIHMSFDMKIAARFLGPWSETCMSWVEDTHITECKDVGKKYLVFGAPFIFPNSLNRTQPRQMELFKKMSKDLDLPDISHCSAALHVLVMFSHFNETGGEINGYRLPTKGMSLRTSTFVTATGYLDVGWRGNGKLLVGRWLNDDRFVCDKHFGCCPLWVIEI